MLRSKILYSKVSKLNTSNQSFNMIRVDCLNYLQKLLLYKLACLYNKCKHLSLLLLPPFRHCIQTPMSGCGLSEQLAGLCDTQENSECLIHLNAKSKRFLFLTFKDVCVFFPFTFLLYWTVAVERDKQWREGKGTKPDLNFGRCDSMWYVVYHEPHGWPSYSCF